MQPSGFGSGNGITSQSWGRVDFKTWLGITDGSGGTNAWYNVRVETVTQNFATPEFMTDLFGTIETTIDSNFVYRGTLDLKVWKQTFQTTDATKNLYYPTEYTRNVALVGEYLTTGYAVDTMMYKTTDEWGVLIENYEASMMRNKKFYEINKTIERIYQTALATGNFKVIAGLQATDVLDEAASKKAYRDLKNAGIAYTMKWTTQNKGIPENFKWIFAPYTFQGALDSLGQTSITASESAYGAYSRGEVLKWYGFNIQEYRWLGNNYFFNVDVSEDQRLQSNATGEDFDFTNIAAMLVTPKTIIRKARKPFFTFLENGGNTGFFYQAFVGGSNIVDLARQFNFSIDVFVEPFKEAWNLVVLKAAPSETDILNARKTLATLYPTLYAGIDETTGYMKGDSGGTKTKAMIAQWIGAAQTYVYSQSNLPQDSNIYGFKANLVNTNGITKAQATAKSK